MPVNTAILVLNVELQVLAVIVPHTPVTVHQIFLRGPSHEDRSSRSFVAPLFGIKGLVNGREVMAVALAQSSLAGAGTGQLIWKVCVSMALLSLSTKINSGTPAVQLGRILLVGLEMSPMQFHPVSEQPSEAIFQ